MTGRPKTTVYFHIRNIPLRDERIALLRKQHGERIRRYALERKGKSNRPFDSFEDWTPERVALVGHLLFDGEINRGAIYNNRSAVLVKEFERLIGLMYQYEPRRWQNPATGVFRVSYHNVELANYLKTKSERLLKEISGLSIECKKAFVKAFFDDEGCIDFRPESNRRRIRGYQKDRSRLEIIHSLLFDLDISSRVLEPNEVVIVGKENLMRFENSIGFSGGIYMNGNRSNSRWKRDIEKRELLRLAIKSFKS